MRSLFLELLIHTLSKLLITAYRVQRLATDRHRELIATRSPETVAKMEKQRGLR